MSLFESWMDELHCGEKLCSISLKMDAHKVLKAHYFLSIKERIWHSYCDEKVIGQYKLHQNRESDILYQ